MSFILYLFVVYLCFLSNITAKSSVDPSKSKIWGPGLAPTRIVLPARYFFVHLYNSSGHPLTEAPEEDIDAYIGGPKSGQCRIWTQILNRKDGSFIVRYKMYHPCSDMKIDVRYQNKPIQGFPIYFKTSVLSDDCYCPQKLDQWLESMECKPEYQQITSDLNWFRSVDFSSLREVIIDKFNQPNSVSLCHYIVKNNNVYRNCYGKYVGFKIFMDSILLSLTRKAVLPDVEMFVNLGDWPLIRYTDENLPIFSWCGSENTKDIVMPTYDITESTLECMGRVMLDMLSVQSNTGPQWSEKVQKAFWRGRDASEERLKLIEISRQYPELFNASLTNFFFFRDKEAEYGPKQPHVSFFDFFQYKYQINMDGTVAAYRLPYLLAGDSVVLKQESTFYEHFYKQLEPNVHYIPFKRDLSDLVEKLNWLKENDKEARKIAKTGQEYTRENLLPRDIFCYYAALLKEWSSRLVSPVEVLPGMEHVEHPQPEIKCECPATDADHDEL